MVWIKREDGKYINENSIEIIDLNELNEKIEKLQYEINDIESKKLKFPDNALPEIINAIDLYNQLNYDSLIDAKKGEIEILLNKKRLILEDTNE